MGHSFHVFHHDLKTFERDKRLGFASMFISFPCFHTVIDTLELVFHILLTKEKYVKESVFENSFSLPFLDYSFRETLISLKCKKLNRKILKTISFPSEIVFSFRKLFCLYEALAIFPCKFIQTHSDCYITIWAYVHRHKYKRLDTDQMSHVNSSQLTTDDMSKNCLTSKRNTLNYEY